MIEIIFRNNYDLRRIGELWVMIIFEETTHSLPHILWVFLHKRKLFCYFDIEISIFFVLFRTMRNCCSLRIMNGKRKRVETIICKEWKKTTKIWDILEQGQFMGFMEKLKGSNLTITHQFIKTWKNGRILVGNHRMEVTKDIIAEATGLDMYGINFYRDRKLFDHLLMCL